MDENDQVMVSEKELRKLKRQALFGKAAAICGILHPIVSLVLLFTLLITGIFFCLTFETSYSALRTDLCVGFFIPEGEYEGFNGNDHLDFTISKDNPRDKGNRSYTVKVLVNGEKMDYYELYYKQGSMHLSKWPYTRASKKGSTNVIRKNEDDSFSVLTTIEGEECIRFWQKG